MEMLFTEVEDAAELVSLAKAAGFVATRRSKKVIANKGETFPDRLAGERELVTIAKTIKDKRMAIWDAERALGPVAVKPEPSSEARVAIRAIVQERNAMGSITLHQEFVFDQRIENVLRADIGLLPDYARPNTLLRNYVIA